MTPIGLTAIDIEEQYQPSYTYRWDEESGRVMGYVDGAEAVFQAVKKILSTQRYSSLIYDSEYGTETDRLIGTNYDFLVSDLPRVINEALLSDNRILSTTNYIFTQTSADSLEANFYVETVEGELLITQEVQL